MLASTPQQSFSVSQLSDVDLNILKNEDKHHIPRLAFFSQVNTKARLKRRLRQLEVSSFRESKPDVRRFYVFAEAKTLHLRARSSGDQRLGYELWLPHPAASSLRDRLIRGSR
ncbi:hypothetical protein MLD38_019671 [Melastoma candidum]|uniref:Uncharacterized protein n=1 Tax=Melastoma candidum TaxID=119954 RepID=A0ACB9R199_9MYRT|nr:hypothetical protein MLD38_019671 [Melastoma candidum]